jgi:hypothetical protein
MNQTKTCKTCKTEKQITEFGFHHSNRKTCKRYLNASCKYCTRISNKKYIDDRKYKGKCMYCKTIFKTNDPLAVVCNGCNALKVMKSYINKKNIIMTWI